MTILTFKNKNLKNYLNLFIKLIRCKTKILN